jgi:hypothetical protein
VLNLVWKHLLPACSEEVLPEEPAAQHRLSRKLERLCLPRPESGVGSQLEKEINGRSYQMQPNEARVEKISFAFNPQHCLVKAETGGQPEQLICGRGAWISGETHFLLSAITPMPVPAMPVLASAAWMAEDTLTLTLRYIETPFYFNITCRFAGDELHVQPQGNVAFDPNAQVELVGKAI